MSRTVSSSGRNVSPASTARETSTSCIAAESGSEIQSGSSIHSPTSCSFSTSAGTQSKVASLPLTSRQVSSVSRQLRPGCVAL